MKDNQNRTMSPVSLRIDVTEIQTVLFSDADIGDSPGNLPSNECPPSPRALMVEQDPVTRIHAICLTVIHRDPIRIKFSDTVRAARIEWSCFTLGCLDNLSIEL